MFGIPYVYTQSRILKVNQNFFESSTLQFVKYWLFVKVQNLEVVRSHDDRVVRGYSRLSSLLVARDVSLPRNVSRRQNLKFGSVNLASSIKFNWNVDAIVFLLYSVFRPTLVSSSSLPKIWEIKMQIYPFTLTPWNSVTNFHLAANVVNFDNKQVKINSLH